MKTARECYDCAPPGRPSSVTSDIGLKSVEFETALMRAMIGTNNDAASAWITKYAERIRDILDTDASILALVRTKQYAAAITHILPLLAR